MQKFYHLMVNGINYKWELPLIQGSQIKQLGRIEPTADLYLVSKGHQSDELITDEQQVDLSKPGIEKFYSKDSQVMIVVNSREHVWDKPEISYDELVVLAYGNVAGNVAYTITYSNGPIQTPEGFVVKGEVVVVCNKMNFNVTGTCQS
jgi:hypothetical protein